MKRAVRVINKSGGNNRRGPQQSDKQIGIRIRTARVEKGMSQGELGDRLGVSFQQIQKYEKGTNRCARILEISKILGVSINSLYGIGETLDWVVDKDEPFDVAAYRQSKKLAQLPPAFRSAMEVIVDHHLKLAGEPKRK